MQNDQYMANTAPVNTVSVNTVPAKPAVKKRRGTKMGVVSVILGGLSWILEAVAFWFMFWLAYGRQNQDVIMVGVISLPIALAAVLAIVLGIIAKVRGAHTGLLIAAIILSVLAVPFICFNIYILVYYIGMTY